MGEAFSPPEPAAREAYDAWHLEHATDAGAEAPWHRLIRLHLDASRDLTGRRVLEIGCGRGEFACWMAGHPQAPRTVVAADFSPAAVEIGKQAAREQGLNGIHWEINDIQAIQHPAESFDTVFSCETVEHVPQPELAIRELARVLRPGGRLFLTTPSYLGPLGLYRIYLRLRGRQFTEVGQPINNFLLLPRTRSWVAAAGLTVRSVDGAGHYLPLRGGMVEAPWLARPHSMMKWLGLHTLIVAEKPLR